MCTCCVMNGVCACMWIVMLRERYPHPQKASWKVSNRYEGERESIMIIQAINHSCYLTGEISSRFDEVGP